jgi:predicted secreted protein
MECKMKNLIKLIGIIAIVALVGFVFAACDTDPNGNNGECNDCGYLDCICEDTDNQGTFVPVVSITGIPKSGFVNQEIPLYGVVNPNNATNRSIVWSIKEYDTDETPVLNVDTLTALDKGTVTVTATIKNGLTETSDFTQDFEIEFALLVLPVVESVAFVTTPPPTHAGPFTVDGLNITTTEGSFAISHLEITVTRNGNPVVSNLDVIPPDGENFSFVMNRSGDRKSVV